MCGIIGSWAYRPFVPVQTDWCRSEIRRIAHRGPEGSTIVEGPNFVFGHCLLSFHDYSSAAQPYCTPEQDLVVTFNGEIYNYDDLRAELEASGTELKTTSECELIAVLYRRLGQQTFTKLRGMFAIALADQKTFRLILVRDYIGKKPLFFKLLPDLVIFASEASPFYAVLDNRTINARALMKYFLHNAVPADECIADGVEKLGPGELVVIANGEAKRTRYWTPPSVERFTEGTLEDTASTLDGLLRTAVRRRLRFQDDKLGLLLSGGLDSSLIAALIVEESASEKRVACYTATFDDDQSGDARHAGMVADSLGLNHIPVHMSGDDVVEGAEAYLARLDEPIADPSFLAVAAITRHARGRFKAFLTGDGADDLFMGYALYRALGILHLIERIDPKGRLSRRLANSALFRKSAKDMGPSHVITMLARCVGAPDGAKFAAATSAFDERELKAIMSADLDVAEKMVPEADYGRTALRGGMMSGLLQARILSKLDRGSMLNGIELRNPFLDQDVAEFALRLPTDQLWYRREGKQILRTVATRKRLDPSVLTRRKQGFRLPMDALLRMSLRELVCDTLSASSLKRGGLFRPDAVGKLLSAHMRGERDLSKKIWALFCFQIWQSSWAMSDVR